ncbi:PREDICTED: PLASMODESMATA CALLOSE-BINDING PROTEIN 4-like [Tarenaya hassleriana]|uniref:PLASMODESMATA CALLOSE-BINDING PROTEIN 4-like n=1 Tax=Tarenaya hassleriana TaxID=28532 RepID=UPI00053C84B7|nr:PREDICTED: PLASMODESMATA CALLOSE-BINDING PROTEIN 4-like [Tarenaya hassleriana]
MHEKELLLPLYFWFLPLKPEGEGNNMTHLALIRCFPALLFYLLITSAPNALAQGQGDLPVVNPTNPGGSTTTPTITQPSPPAPTQPGPVTTPTSPGGGGGGGNFGSGGGGGGGGGQWCIASPSASPKALQVALDYACGYGGADCGLIQQGASCSEPNTVHDHASYAFNDYYQKHPGSESCVFGGTAQLTSTDPSKGNCHFPASSGATSTSPPNPLSPPAYTSPTNTVPTTTSTTTPTTPTTGFPGTGPTTTSTTTPTTPTTGFPGTGPVYGVAEPTGLPSSANLASGSLLPLLVAAGILMPLLGEKYL